VLLCAQLIYDSEEPKSVAIIAATQITALERCSFVPPAQYSAFKQQVQAAELGLIPNKLAAAIACSFGDAALASAHGADAIASAAARAEAAQQQAAAVPEGVVQPLEVLWLPAVAAAGYACGNAVQPPLPDMPAFEFRRHELTTHVLLGACCTSTKTLLCSVIVYSA
jgi:hypothetical protein